MSGTGPRPVDAPITGSVDAAERERFDLIVIGGGIYGILALREAARRGIHGILLERDDFGGATSWSSHRIVHGGLRYLQSADLSRFTQSVRERKWFAETLPGLVEPLACLMPLYGDGLKRPAALRAALAVNSLLGKAVGGSTPRIPGGRVWSAAETRTRAGLPEAEPVRGGAAWHDGRLISSERAMICLLRDACRRGAAAVNRVRVVRPEIDNGEVRGVAAVDERTGRELLVRAPAVLNCAGPWLADESLVSDPAERRRLFMPARAFNLVLDGPPPSESALAVSARRPGSPVLFVVPMDGLTAAGTWHEPAEGASPSPRPTARSVKRFLAELRDALPGFDADRSRIRAIWSGLLPAAADGGAEPSDRPVIVEHRPGFVSVSGVKLTTARLVAVRALARLLPDATDPGPDEPIADPLGNLPLGFGENVHTQEMTEAIERMRREEAAESLADVVLRRSRWYLARSPESLSGALAAGLDLETAQADHQAERVWAFVRCPLDP